MSGPEPRAAAGRAATGRGRDRGCSRCSPRGSTIGSATDAPVTQLDHALQTAALLAHLYPGDDELAAAGLVHDIGHLLPGGADETHADDRGACGTRALGERVAGRWDCTWRRSGISWRPTRATAACWRTTASSRWSPGRCHDRRRGGGVPGAPVGSRRRAAAPGRRQREGRRPGRGGTRPVGRAPARLVSSRANTTAG